MTDPLYAKPGAVSQPQTFGWAFCPGCGKLKRIVALKNSDGTSGVMPEHDAPDGTHCRVSTMYWAGCQKPWWPDKNAALESRKAVAK